MYIHICHVYNVVFNVHLLTFKGFMLYFEYSCASMSSRDVNNACVKTTVSTNNNTLVVLVVALLLRPLQKFL